MTDYVLEDLIKRYEIVTHVYSWKCPLCGLEGDDAEMYDWALEDLRYHINEDHKGEEE